MEAKPPTPPSQTPTKTPRQITEDDILQDKLSSFAASDFHSDKSFT
jgi:hypothetical protein